MLIDHARVECQSHHFSYNEDLGVQTVTQSVADLYFDEGKGKKKMSRPFGTSLLIAGIDENGPSLYQTDPSGTFHKWEARAIGSAAEGAQAYIQESYSADMSIDEAKKLCLQTLKNVMEEKINKWNVEIAAITTESKKFEIFTPDHVDGLIGTLS